LTALDLFSSSGLTSEQQHEHVREGSVGTSLTTPPSTHYDAHGSPQTAHGVHRGGAKTHPLRPHSSQSARSLTGPSWVEAGASSPSSSSKGGAVPRGGGLEGARSLSRESLYLGQSNDEASPNRGISQVKLKGLLKAPSPKKTKRPSSAYGPTPGGKLR